MSGRSTSLLASSVKEGASIERTFSVTVAVIVMKSELDWTLEFFAKLKRAETPAPNEGLP